MSVAERVRVRRADLLRWLEERPEHQGLTAGEIALVSGLYSDLRDGEAAALADLRDGRFTAVRDVRGGIRVRVWYPSEARS